MNNPIADQIVDTLTNLRREVSTQGITTEADMLWQHALSLYRMRRDSPPVNAGAVGPSKERTMIDTNETLKL